MLKFEGISDRYQDITIAGSYWLKGMGWNTTFTDFMIDKSGIFWFGSRSQGILKYDPEKKPFEEQTKGILQLFDGNEEMKSLITSIKNQQ